MKRLALLAAPLFVLACGNNEQQAPPPHYAAPPVAITSAPPPAPAPPPPPPPPAPPPGGGEGRPQGMGPGMHHPAPGMHEGRENGHVYKLDFLLTSKEGTTAQPPASFTLVLLEGNHGEVHVGKNVPLQATGTGPSPRQDVGLKVRAQYRTVGDDVLLEISTEMSAQEGGGAIRKVSAQGNALASPGKPSLVVALDDDKKHYELTVTPTKLR